MNSPDVVMNPAMLAEIPRTMVLPFVMMRAQRVEEAARAQIRFGHVHASLQDVPSMARKVAKPEGNLADTIVKRVLQSNSNDVTVRVGTDSDHAIFVHEGTGPHVIRARNARALFFYGAATGMFVLVPSTPPRNAYVNKNKILVSGKDHVDHPGTQPNRFLTDNLHLAIMP